MHRVPAAVECDQRLAERDQRVEVIRVALQQIDQEVERFGRLSEFALQRRQLERGIGVRRDGVERGGELARRVMIVTSRLEQPGELKPHHGKVGIDSQRVSVCRDRAVDVTGDARDIADPLLNVGTLWRERCAASSAASAAADSPESPCAVAASIRISTSAGWSRINRSAIGRASTGRLRRINAHASPTIAFRNVGSSCSAS